jgi:hypothetical protein
MEPDGAGRPPGGSSVIATVIVEPDAPGGGGTISMPRRGPSPPINPALTGDAPDGPISHTW